MIVQVHDELVFEVPDQEIESMKKLVPEGYGSAIALSVPVKVVVGTGTRRTDYI